MARTTAPRRGPRPVLSVIVPTLDEAGTLPALLADLHAQRGVPLEVIVADGGSADTTLAVARRAGARVVQAPKGRGAQMNAGRAAAHGRLLLFLHADSRCPPLWFLADALHSLKAEGAEHVAGHFALRFERAMPGHDRFFAWLEGKTRTNRPGTINGDQGLLIAAEWFDALGGFDEGLPFLEDQHLAQQIFDTGRWIVLPGELRTSARRFEAEGHYRRYAVMALIMAMHAAGADDFLRDVPGLYRAQAEARTLSLAPFVFRALPHLLRRGPAGLLGVGRLCAANLWQVRYAADVLRNRAPPAPSPPTARPPP